MSLEAWKVEAEQGGNVAQGQKEYKGGASVGGDDSLPF